MELEASVRFIVREKGQVNWSSRYAPLTGFAEHNHKAFHQNRRCSVVPILAVPSELRRFRIERLER